MTDLNTETPSNTSLEGSYWWHEPFRMFQTNLREVDAGLNVEAVLDYIEDYGANAWLISIGGILSNYPTTLPFQTANPHLAERETGDLIGDAMQAATRRGVHLLGRMDFSKIDRRRAEEHPEWCFVDPNGEPQVYNGLTSVCPSGDYYQLKLFEVLDEVLDRYPVDGFFLNWMSYNEVDYSKQYRGACQCLPCQHAFGEFAPDATLPIGPESPSYQLWRRFAAAKLDDLTARIRERITSRRPEAVLILGDRSDMIFHEANNAVGRQLWHHSTSEQVSAAKSYQPNKPVLVNSVGFVDMPYRQAGEEPYHFAQYLIQAIARGANPSTYIMGTPDVVHYECLELAGDIVRYHRDNAEVYRDLVPDARVLLLRPDPLKHAPERLVEIRSEFQGLYLALQERHISFDVLPESKLVERASGKYGLDQYRAIVLPDLGSLSADTVNVIDSFVEGGGAAVSTGSSGFDGDTSQFASSPAESRLAIRNTIESVRSLHLPVPKDDKTFPVPVIGAFHSIKPKPTATASIMALSRAPYGPPEKCHGHIQLDQPGLVVGAAGQGAFAVLPWTIGRGYREIGLSAFRDLFADTLLKMAPGVALQSGVGDGAKLPEQIEVISGRSKVGTVIHLLNRSGDDVQRFREPLPIAPATIALESANCRVHALQAGEELPIRMEGDRPYIQLPEIRLFETIVIERS